MKLPSVLLALIAFLATSLHAAVGPISITVEQNSKTRQPQAKPGKPAQGAKTQVRSLTVRLSNNSAESFDSLVVKYWFLGHDMKDHNIKVLKQGERKSALVPRGRDTVDSEEVTSAYTEAHSEVTKGKGGKGGKGGSKGGGVKKVAASGQKITGYAVQVVNGTKVEAEYYSEPSYKEKVAAAAPSNLPASKAPAKKSSAKKKKKT
jgi:hypothetical protein